MRLPSLSEWIGLCIILFLYGSITTIVENWELVKQLTVFFGVGLGIYILIRNWWLGDFMDERRARRKTWRLYRKLNRKIKKLEQEYALDNDEEEDDLRRFGGAVYRAFPDGVPEELDTNLLTAVMELYQYEAFDVVGVHKPPALCNSIEGGKYRDDLNRLSRFLEGHGTVRGIAIKQMREACVSFLQNFDFGAQTGDVLAERSIAEDPQAPIAIESLMQPIFSQDTIAADLFTGVREQLMKNACEASGLPDTQESRESPDLVLPTEYEGDELAYTYLKRTPFLPVLQSTIPFSIPRHVRYEHTMVVGGSGHGKTTLLQSMILNDLELAKRGEAGFAVIDPKGSLVDAIAKLECFAPESGELADKIIIIDPRRDIAFPPAINMFDLGFAASDELSLADKLAVRNNALEMIEYMFSELLKVEMTGRQEVAFNYVGDLMMNIPGATIMTLLEFLNRPHDFLQHIAKCDATTRDYLERQFITDRFKSVRDQLSDRVYGVLKLPMMEAMFSHSKTRVDVAKAVNEGKVVLINANENFLSTSGSSVFGSVWIGLLFQACLSRVTIPEQDRKGFTLYIDEASMFFSEKLRQMLIKAREFKLGVVFAFQDLEQIESPQLRASALGSTSTKFVGGLNARDRRVFANEMNTTEEFLRKPKKDQEALQTEFATYVRGETPSPVILTFPIGKMGQEPVMTEAEFEGLVDSNRASVSVMPTVEEGKLDDVSENGVSADDSIEIEEPARLVTFDDEFTIVDDD